MLSVITGLLLVDSVYLIGAMYLTGGMGSPIRFLIYLHLVAVSLLASYRTGLKLALWDSLLLLVVLYAQAAELVPPVDVVPGQAIEFEQMPMINLISFWLFALATSVFSAMNERELRQRRADLQALVDVGAPGVAAGAAPGAVRTPERMLSVKRIAGRSVRSVVTSPFSQAITSSLSVLPSVMVKEWLDGTLNL